MALAAYSLLLWFPDRALDGGCGLLGQFAGIQGFAGLDHDVGGIIEVHVAGVDDQMI